MVHSSSCSPQQHSQPLVQPSEPHALLLQPQPGLVAIESEVVIDGRLLGVDAPTHEAPILTALSRAFHWQRLLDEGRVASGSEIARREGLHPTTVNELLRLTLLSPTVVKGLLAGKQPRTLSLIWLKNHEVPASWDDQAALFGRMDR